MKLVVQIPAFNEEDCILRAIEDVRKHSLNDLFDQIEIIVIDDGSTDNTVARARQAGIEHIVKLKEHQGLGEAFKQGLVYGLSIGADVIVNFDADMQYRAQDMISLIKPLLDDQVDIVIGDRQLSQIKKYPRIKLISQHLGNQFIGAVYHAKVNDSTSGFRALSRSCAQWLASRTLNNYTYTVESLCLLLKGRRQMRFVPVVIRETVRESRLIRNKLKYIYNYIAMVLSCLSREA